MSQRRNESFLLRITIDESLPGETPVWRGRVQHIGSGIDQQFDTLEELTRAVKAQIDFNPQLAPLHRGSHGTTQ
ncbi:MAG: hypothetical protein H7Z42_19380 [Roseiflexaceae bacterium]|nr:hypothetical protein [Roseiflexaceae bacterium]